MNKFMKELPIKFNMAMVQAVLEGRKTQTRRLIKKADHGKLTTNILHTGNNKWQHHFNNGKSEKFPGGLLEIVNLKCPYGIPGDKLWVRETWSPDLDSYIYRADGCWEDNKSITWKPSTHMPRKASRVILDVARIRVERVQSITPQDAIAEGVESVVATRERFGCRASGMLLYRNYLDKRTEWATGYESPIDSFCTLWNSIYDSRGYGWDVNPWCWVVDFRVLPEEEKIA